MSGPMKKNHTEKTAHVIWHGNKYAVPLRVMEKFKVSDRKANKTIDDVFGDITKESGEPAVLLRGLRYREGLTQVEFAKLINITQANLSAIENG